VNLPFLENDRLATITVSARTRDALQAIADTEGLSLDSAIRKLLRFERQHQMGVDLAERGETEEDRAWISGSNTVVTRVLG
jgi:hypothetical protein